MQIDPNPGIRSLLAALSCVVAVGISIAFVDRAVATWSHQTFHGARVFVLLTHIVDPVLPGAALGLTICAVMVMSGWRPDRIGRTFIACCFAGLVAYAIKDQAKIAFGRLWPETWVNNNPSWISNGAYGFSPFHGGAGWGSFPSGHMTAITAPLSVVWHRAPRWRWLVALLVLLVAVGLLGADYHFLGDVIAGIYLGAACGTGVLAALHAGWTEEWRPGPQNAEPHRRGPREKKIVDRSCLPIEPGGLASVSRSASSARRPRSEADQTPCPD